MSNLSDSQTSKSHPDHLCVFVHGLWGNPQHLKYPSEALRQKYGEDQLKILVCKRNASSFTYDGIEVGGERVTREIEEYIKECEKEGCKITKFSIVGYSLGGLIARYSIGLLYQKGFFEKIKPVNFTTFATPHLGVRVPRRGYAQQFWNALGARTLSASGQQLFLVDNFRDTNRTLLSVLADPESIFMHALAQFRHRCLYTNIINDRSAPYYTTSISKRDPYKQMDKLKLRYLSGYESVMLDPDKPFEIISHQGALTFSEWTKQHFQRIISWAPRALALTIFIPIGVTVFLINSTIQTFRSRRRILVHENDSEGLGFQGYRSSWLAQDMRVGMERAFGVANSVQRSEYIVDDSEDSADNSSLPKGGMLVKRTSKESKVGPGLLRRVSTSTTGNPFTKLALTDDQFAMIEALDEVGFTKYPVHITQSTHSHAAIIVRHERAAFDEGKIVIKHWLAEEFEL